MDNRERALGFTTKNWWIIVSIVFLFHVVVRLVFSQTRVPASLGAMGASFLIAFIPIWLMKLGGMVLKKEPSNISKRSVFFPVLILTLFSSIERARFDEGLMSESNYLPECVQGVKAKFISLDKEFLVDEYDIEKYCSCMFDKMKSGEFQVTKENIHKFEDPNSIETNEVAVPCFESARYKDHNNAKLSGSEVSDTIPLINLNGVSKAKLKIGDKFYYLIYDTGASDIFLDKRVENDLWNSGLIDSTNYRDNEFYETASGEIIECKTIVIDNVVLGSFKVDNVTIAIQNSEQGIYLLGNSFFNDFNTRSVIDNGASLVISVE